MKKVFMSLLLVLVLIPSSIFAATKYQVPVKLEKFGEPGKESMGNPSLRQVADVEEKDGKYIYKLYLKKMEFMNMEGELTNLYIYEGDKDSSRVETKQSPLSGEYNKVHEFVRTSPKEDKILVAVWVDAMDAIAGGGKGSGEQKAYLKFDWANAKTLEEKKEDQSEKSNSQIKIIVNDKELTPDPAPYVENSRTMVPLRFISEALGLKVDWDGANKTITIGDGLAKLTIDSNIVNANGKDIKIDSPAKIKSGRTFVPLRAIAEITGAKVDWDGASKTVKITK